MSKFDEIFEAEELLFDPSREVDDVMRESRREALEDALSRVDALDDFWAVFRQAVTEAIVDDGAIRQIVVDARVKVLRAIYESEYERLLDLSATKMISAKRTEVLHEAANRLLNDPRSASEIKAVAVALVSEQLREEVRKQARDQLMKDDAFVEEVKRELKRQIMGI